MESKVDLFGGAMGAYESSNKYSSEILFFATALDLQRRGTFHKSGRLDPAATLPLNTPPTHESRAGQQRGKNQIGRAHV